MTIRPKVLVVDDDGVQLTVVRAWLESAGYRVATHDRSMGMPGVIAREQPEVVLLDSVLSGEAFEELVSRTFQSYPVQIIFHNRRPAGALQELAASLGAGVIPKTTDGKWFLSRFTELVSRGAGSPRPQTPASETAAPSEASPGPTGKVLLVDDDQAQLEALSACLRGAGYEVITHDRAMGTATLVFRERPDVIVLDVMLPELNGDALARLLRPTWDELGVKIVFHTGKDPEELPPLPAELPVLGIIKKGPDLQGFLREFQQALSRIPRPKPPE